MSESAPEPMSYTRACEILGYRLTNSVEKNAKLAKSRLEHASPRLPLRYKHACRVLIEALEKAPQA